MICGKCKSDKREEDFYRSNKTKCKECVREAVRNNRMANQSYYREYDRHRAKNDPKVAERAKKYQSTDAGKSSKKKAMDRYRRYNPVKYKAHNIVNNALRDGHITKEPCEVCGSEFSHAHHDDYFKPLCVRWLCAAHHQQWHAENGEAANGSATIEEFNIAVYGLKAG